MYDPFGNGKAIDRTKAEKYILKSRQYAVL